MLDGPVYEQSGSGVVRRSGLKLRGGRLRRLSARRLRDAWRARAHALEIKELGLRMLHVRIGSSNAAQVRRSLSGLPLGL